MYILSHFGRSYCVFQILIQMTVIHRIINTPHIFFYGPYNPSRSDMWLLYYLTMPMTMTNENDKSLFEKLIIIIIIIV